MPKEQGRFVPMERIRTGIPGLDTVLQGGFLCYSTNLVIGPSGSGKTILGTQIAFSQVAEGGSVVYFTVLSEPHSRLLSHIGQLSFFDVSAIPDRLYFVSVYQELEQNGTDALLQLIRRLIRERRATLAVIDGLSAIEGLVGSRATFEKFLHELQATFVVGDCTALLLASQDRERDALEHALVDSVIWLGERSSGLRVVRELSVLKLRGSDSLRGRHVFTISNRGITVFPRLEALVRREARVTAEERAHLSFGIKGLDEMLRGGLLSGSTTTLLGPAGSGKTLFGLSFLAAGGHLGEQGMYYGFYETPSSLSGKADNIGLAFSSLVEGGRVGLYWEPPLEGSLDKIGQKILTKVRRRKVKRLFLDGVGGLRETAMFEERVPSFLTALAVELRALGVTTLFSEEVELFCGEPQISLLWLSALVENIILLRYVERHARLLRVLSILKVREQEYDSSLREFTISGRGIEVMGMLDGAGGDQGDPHRPPSPPEAGGANRGRRGKR